MGTGMGMMLKSMGLDPDKLRADIEEVRRGAAAVIANFDLRLVKVEQRLDHIEQLLVRLVLRAEAERQEEAAPEMGADVAGLPPVV